MTLLNSKKSYIQPEQQFLRQKLGFDIVYMPPCEGFKFLVVARCDLPVWVEAKLLRTFSSQAIVDFLGKDIICYQSCFGKLVIDWG